MIKLGQLSVTCERICTEYWACGHFCWLLISFVLQTVWTPIRLDKMSGLIWIKLFDTLGIIELLSHCKGGNFNIHILVWFGYLICSRREFRFYLFGKELISCLSLANVRACI